MKNKDAVSGNTLKINKQVALKKDFKVKRTFNLKTFENILINNDSKLYFETILKAYWNPDVNPVFDANYFVGNFARD